MMGEPTKIGVAMLENPAWWRSEKRYRQHPENHEFVNEDQNVS
jgi:hypothetical protein